MQKLAKLVSKRHLKTKPTDSPAPPTPAEVKAEAQVTVAAVTVVKTAKPKMAGFDEKYSIEPTPGLDDYNHVVSEILASLKPMFKKLEDDGDVALAEKYFRIFKNLIEPEQIHRWKAVWEDDKGILQVNTCWRVQQNSALGPYKGGLRFDPAVKIDTLRFLAVEQVFKNALTGKQMGGGKGGSNFNPKGKSDGEIRRFCQAFMLGLHKHIGPDIDVPAGDIGVGGKVIGNLFGMWKKLGLPHVGILTGKALLNSGSLLRPEATGYGCVYVLKALLDAKLPDSFADPVLWMTGKKILISGAGNVATFCAKKCYSLGGIVLSMSDRTYIYWTKNEKIGLTDTDVDAITLFKETGQDKLMSKNVNVYPVDPEGELRNVWCSHPDVAVDYAFPSATQNEIDEKDAKNLVFERKVTAIIEGSNMSSTAAAMEVYREREDHEGEENKSAPGRSFYYLGAKLANLGGVGTSYLEMEQNAAKAKWSAEKVDMELESIMRSAFAKSDAAAAEYGVSVAEGANIAAFKMVSSAMLELGYAA